MRSLLVVLCLALLQAGKVSVSAFSLMTPTTIVASATVTTTTRLSAAPASDGDEDELVAKRLVVSGDVQGGYVRACVVNEAGRFRRLVGSMTDPDTTSDEAEIYVEGKRKLVNGFVRWCERGNVGLSQSLHVVDIIDEEPTGLYESFYCKTKDDE